MDTLPLDCSICKESFGYLMDLLSHKTQAHPEARAGPSREISAVPVEEEVASQDWIAEAI